MQAFSFAMSAGTLSLPILVLTIPALLASVAAYHALQTLAAGTLEVLVRGALGIANPEG